MIKKQLYSAISLIFIVFVFSTHSFAEISQVGREFIAYSKFSGPLSRNLAPDARANAIGEKYDELFKKYFSRSNIAKVSTVDLIYIFRATDDVLFYKVSPSYATNMQLIVEDLERRKKVTDQQLQTLFRVYVSVRWIDRAMELKRAHSSIISDQLPSFLDVGNASNAVRTEWKPKSDDFVLERANVDLSKGTVVVMTAHPRCHFSNNAIKAFESDKDLMTKLSGHLKLIVPQGRDLDFELIQQWNRIHKDTPMSYVYEQREWPEISDWSTPIFYFFKNGTLVQRIDGWPSAGNKEKVLQALSQLESE